MNFIFDTYLNLNMYLDFDLEKMYSALYSDLNLNRYFYLNCDSNVNSDLN